MTAHASLTPAMRPAGCALSFIATGLVLWAGLVHAVTDGNGGARELRPDYVVRTLARAPADWSPAATSSILLNLQPDGNACRLDITRDAFRLQRREGGRDVLLAGPVPIPEWPAAGLPVLIRRQGDRLTCLVGNAKLSRVDASLAGGSCQSEAAPGGPILDVLRVQPTERLAFADDFMRAAGEAGPWTGLSGTWALDELPNASWSPNAFRYTGRGTDDCLAAAGAWFWDSYAWKAAVRPGPDCGAAGLAAYVNGPADFAALRWLRRGDPDPQRLCAGVLQVVRRRSAGEQVVAETPCKLDPHQWYEFGLAVDEGRLTGFLDGRALLHAEVPGNLWGQIGLYCRDAPGVSFDDVVLHSLPLPSAGSTHTGSETSGSDELPGGASSVAERFRTDRFMQQWASELGTWVRGGHQADDTYWHLGLFPGDLEVAWAGDYGAPFDQGPLLLILTTDRRESREGYALTVKRMGRLLEAALQRADRPLVTWQSPLPPGESVGELVFSRRGGALALAVNGRECGRYVDPEPLATRRLGVRCSWSQVKTLTYFAGEEPTEERRSLPSVQDIVASGPHLRDYLFHTAPVDWFADTGTWEVTSRWICLPQFSWLGGRSHESAIFWNKRRFSGDMVVDLHAAVMMDYGPMSGYDRYGDLCLSLCADGRDLSSGYTVQFGAEGNTVSRLLKGGTVVAENRTVLYPPRSQGAHQNWYHLTVEKLGAELVFSVDNREVCRFTDPAPLAGGHVAIWTWNRGLMVARTRIWAERDEGTPAPTFRATASLEPAAAPTAATSPIRLSSASHGGESYTFDHDLEGWRGRGDEHGAALAWEARGKGGCLRLENPRTGGDVSVPFPVASFDARRWPCLAFEYRLPATTRLNLYLRAFGRWHVIGLTGPTAADAHQVTESRLISGRLTAVAGLQLEHPPPVPLGCIPVTADDAWHEAEFNLLDALQRHDPDAGEYGVSDLHFGNWSNQGYLQCGFSGNRAGPLGRLDNLFLGAAARGPVEFAWQSGQDADSPALSAWQIDRHPAAAAAPAAFTPADRIRLPGLAPGWWYLHVFGAPRDGAAGAVLHQRFRVDTLPPALLATDPAAGSRAAPASLSLSISEPGGSGLDRQGVVLRVAGEPVPALAVAPDASFNGLQVSASLGGREFAEGQTVPCEVTLHDRAGNRLHSYCWEWTFSRSADQTPPTLPQLARPPPSGWDDDVEAHSREWQPFPGSAWVEFTLDDTTASAGRRSLRLRGGPGPYACIVRQKPFDLRARPMLALDYRATRDSTWDLAVETDKGWWVLAVNGGTQRWPVVGRLPSYRPDAQWHTALLPLEDWLQSRSAFKVPVVNAIAVTATRMNAGRPSEVHLDAFRLAPAVAVRPETAVAWSASDVSGVRGYASLLDRDPGSEPPPSATLTGAVRDLAMASPGLHYLHIRAQDNAGNWGPVLHQPLLLRRAATAAVPPRVVRVEPEAAAHAAADVIRVEVEAAAALSPESVRFSVGERVYTFLDPAVRFEPGGRAITWHAPRPDPAATAFQHGEEVTCSIALADDSGVALPAPFAWSWTMDLDADKTAPPAPHISWRPDDVFMVADFEADLGQCIGLREGWSEIWPEDAATGSQCVRFGGFSTFLCYARVDIARFPILGFEYRIPTGGTLNLTLRCENRNWEVQLNGDSAKYPLIGRADGIAADGRWHSCRVNLAEMLAKAPIPPRGTMVDHVGTLNKTGECFFVDDVYLGPATPSTVRLRWSVPRDPSGVRGYSVVVDAAAETIPDETVDTTVPGQTVALGEGPLHYAHVRAIDGAGNAGATAHAVIRVGAP